MTENENEHVSNKSSHAIFSFAIQYPLSEWLTAQRRSMASVKTSGVTKVVGGCVSNADFFLFFVVEKVEFQCQNDYIQTHTFNFYSV